MTSMTPVGFEPAFPTGEQPLGSAKWLYKQLIKRLARFEDTSTFQALLTVADNFERSTIHEGLQLRGAVTWCIQWT